MSYEMNYQRNEIKTVDISYMELGAALRMSQRTAEREGCPRKAEEVQGYIDTITEMAEVGGKLFGTTTPPLVRITFLYQEGISE